MMPEQEVSRLQYDRDYWKKEGKQKMASLIDELDDFMDTVPTRYRFFVRVSMFECIADRLK